MSNKFKEIFELFLFLGEPAALIIARRLCLYSLGMSGLAYSN